MRNNEIKNSIFKKFKVDIKIRYLLMIIDLLMKNIFQYALNVLNKDRSKISYLIIIFMVQFEIKKS